MLREVQTRKVVIARRVERFSGNRLAALIEDKGFTRSDFVRACIRRAPEDMKPGESYVTGVLTGANPQPGSDYLTLFAKILECSRDAFFVKEAVS